MKLSKFILIFFILLASSVSAYSAPRCSDLESTEHLRDQADMIRDWGYALFKPNDPVFFEKEYLEYLLLLAQPYAHGQYATQSKSQRLTNEINRRFMTYWTKNTNFNSGNKTYRAKIKRFALTGSDANRLALEHIVKQLAYEEQPRSTANLDNYRFISFRDMYISGENSLRNKAITVPSPQIALQKTKLNKKQIMALEYKEAISLEAIEEAVETHPEIAAIMIEPITNGYTKVATYRQEFLIKLKELSQQLEIPIIADEIFTGGGRTGMFWGFNHHESFVPDYITFGKGLIVAGFAETYNVSERLKDRVYMADALNSSRTTVSMNPLMLLQSSQVLKGIYEGNLVENSEKIGNYFKSQLKGGTTGVGLHLNHDFSRLSPPLSFTKEDVDRWIENEKRRSR